MPLVQFQPRHDSSGNWNVVFNPTLASGEMGIDLSSNQFKLGDGINNWINLPYGGSTGPTGLTGPTGFGATQNTGITGLMALQVQQVRLDLQVLLELCIQVLLDSPDLIRILVQLDQLVLQVIQGLLE